MELVFKNDLHVKFGAKEKVKLFVVIPLIVLKPGIMTDLMFKSQKTFCIISVFTQNLSYQ